MFLWCIGQKFHKFRVSIEDTDALEYVAMVKLVNMAAKCELLSNKFWKSIWKLLVDDPVKFISI